MSFEITGQVRYSELGPDGRLSLGALVNYLQDCCAMHSESAGLGPDVWKKRRSFWVVTYWRILIDDYPPFAEKLRIRTWARKYRLTEGDRNHVAEDGSGRVFARADSRWIFFDQEAMRPVRIPEEELRSYPVEEALLMEPAPKHIFLPEDAAAGEPFCVRSGDLDTNRHVNNGRYVAMAQEYLPPDFEVGELRAEYHRQAKLHDVICPKISAAENEVVVSLDNAEGTAYAVVQFLRKT